MKDEYIPEWMLYIPQTEIWVFDSDDLETMDLSTESDSDNRVLGSRKEWEAAGHEYPDPQ